MAFVRMVKVAEVPAGTIRELQVEGKAVAVANVGGKIYAINNTCLHRGGPLGEGSLEGQVVTCPWHGWQFDVTNGKALPGIAVEQGRKGIPRRVLQRQRSADVRLSCIRGSRSTKCPAGPRRFQQSCT